MHACMPIYNYRYNLKACMHVCMGGGEIKNVLRIWKIKLQVIVKNTYMQEYMDVLLVHVIAPLPHENYTLDLYGSLKRTYIYGFWPCKI